MPPPSAPAPPLGLVFYLQFPAETVFTNGDRRRMQQTVNLDALKTEIVALVNEQLSTQAIGPEDVAITQVGEGTLRVEIILVEGGQITLTDVMDVVDDARYLHEGDTDITFVEKLAINLGLPMDAVLLAEAPVILLRVPPSSPPEGSSSTAVTSAPSAPPDTPPDTEPTLVPILSIEQEVNTASGDDGFPPAAIGGIIIAAAIVISGVVVSAYRKAQRRRYHLEAVAKGTEPSKRTDSNASARSIPEASVLPKGDSHVADGSLERSLTIASGTSVTVPVNVDDPVQSSRLRADGTPPHEARKAQAQWLEQQATTTRPSGSPSYSSC